VYDTRAYFKGEAYANQINALLLDTDYLDHTKTYREFLLSRMSLLAIGYLVLGLIMWQYLSEVWKLIMIFSSVRYANRLIGYVCEWDYINKLHKGLHAKQC